MAVQLSVRRVGDGLPVLVMHGLLGQGRNWQAIARRLAARPSAPGGERRAFLLVDLRNHGASPQADPMTYEAMADDVAALVRAEGCGPLPLIGHSMGGKVAMALCLSEPALVERAAILDVAPVVYDHGTFRGYMEAMRAIDLVAAGRRSAVEAALAEVDPDPRVRAFLASNLDVRPEGMRWLPDLDRLLGGLAAILGFPEALAQKSHDGPMLFLRGARSGYVLPEHEPTIRRLFPQAGITTIADAGHWVHADQPEAVVEALAGFLARG